MLTRSRQTAALGRVAALLTGFAGFMAFNVIDGVFGLGQAIVGLLACIATTAFVVWRSPPAEEEPDA